MNIVKTNPDDSEKRYTWTSYWLGLVGIQHQESNDVQSDDYKTTTKLKKSSKDLIHISMMTATQQMPHLQLSTQRRADWGLVGSVDGLWRK